MNGALLFLVFREQTEPADKLADRYSALGYRAFIFTAIVLYEFLIYISLRKAANAFSYLYLCGTRNCHWRIRYLARISFCTKPKPKISPVTP